MYVEVNTYVFRFFREKMVFCEEFEKVNPYVEGSAGTLAVRNWQ